MTRAIGEAWTPGLNVGAWRQIPTEARDSDKVGGPGSQVLAPGAEWAEAAQVGELMRPQRSSVAAA